MKSTVNASRDFIALGIERLGQEAVEMLAKKLETSAPKSLHVLIAMDLSRTLGNELHEYTHSEIIANEEQCKKIMNSIGASIASVSDLSNFDPPRRIRDYALVLSHFLGEEEASSKILEYAKRSHAHLAKIASVFCWRGAQGEFLATAATTKGIALNEIINLSRTAVLSDSISVDDKLILKALLLSAENMRTAGAGETEQSS